MIQGNLNEVCPTKVGMRITSLVDGDLLEGGERMADQTTDSIWLEFMKPPCNKLYVISRATLK